MKNVRVRFAPSPTGFVHVGSLRTALYNYLFAKKNNGTFILRIEDSDQTRYVEGAVENLLNTLKWCGLDYDEGPSKGGKHEPYFQSQRLDIYKQYINELIEIDHAYFCFCSAERLDKMREDQQSKKQAIMYDRKCRTIPKEESLKLSKEQSCVVRMKIPESGNTIINDIIRGEIVFQNELIDDQVLLKSDGYPTYHLANVVDDHLMQISHVIRGEEWLTSTPKHVLLYQYFDWELPEFAHLPLLLNPDRSKLSKRQGDVAVEDFRNKGYLSKTLLNFVALLGWNRGDDQEIFSLEELILGFSLERVNKAGAVFNLEKLNWMNGTYIRNLSEEEYLSKARDEMKGNGFKHFEPEQKRSISLAIRNNLVTFKDIEQKAALFINEKIENYTEESLNLISKEESKNVFKTMIIEMEQIDSITVNDFQEIMKKVQQATGIKGKDLWLPVRAALTGMLEGPELPVVINIYGKNKILNFLKQALDK